MKPVPNLHEAFKDRGIDPDIMPDVSMIPERFQQALLGYYCLMVATEAVNEGEEPDWKDDDQEKYFAWMKVEEDEEKGSGLGLSLGDVDYYCTLTDVGSRLSSLSEDAALHLFNTFKDQYERMMLNPTEK